MTSWLNLTSHGSIMTAARPIRLHGRRLPWPGLLAALVLAASPPAAPEASPLPQTDTLQIPLRVLEPAGVPRVDAPVTAGVPLPASARITDPGQLTLLTRDGYPVPAQIRPLSRWNAPLQDATAPLKWVLVHFRADVAPGDEAGFILSSGGAAAPPGTPLATEAPDGIRVDTGPLAFTVARDRFRIIEQVEIDLDGNGAVDVPIVRAGHAGGVQIERLDGRLYTAAEDVDVSATIEENGPLRTVIRVSGRHRLDASEPGTLDDGEPALTDLEFVARIEAWKGRDTLRLTYTVRNPERFLTSRHNGEGVPVAQVFEGLSLRLPVATLGDPLHVRFGGEDRTTTEFPGARSHDSPLEARLTPVATAALYQDSSGGEAWNDGDRGTTFRGWIAEAGKQPLGRGDHSSGWGSVRALGWSVTVGIRDFWQNFPKGLRFTGDGDVLIDLWPSQTAEPHRLAGGRQKTHEVFFAFRGGASPAREEFLDFADPLHAVAPAEWTAASLALGPVPSTIDRGLDAHWKLARVARATIDGQGEPNDLWSERARQDLYGWRDYGDSYRGGSPTDRHFGNNEFDFGYGLLMQYLLEPSHDRRYLDAAGSMLRHLADFDVYHTDRDAGAYSRGIRQHDTGSTFDHSKPPILSHAWVRGLVTWYWLTGDPIARETALEVGGWIEGLIDPETGEIEYHGQSRSQAWAALALTELWELTGQARYLELAGRLLAAEVVADQDLPGANYPCTGLDWEGDAGETRRDSVSPWQNGYVAEALGRYAFMRRLAGTADRNAEAGLYRLLDELQVCGYATPENGLLVPSDPHRDNEVYGRRYGSLVVDWRDADGGWTIENPNNHFLTDGYAYGALLTPDPERRHRYLQMAQETWRWTMGPESAPGIAASEPAYCCPDTPAKNAAMRLRFGMAYLWLRERLERTPSAPTGR